MNTSHIAIMVGLLAGLLVSPLAAAANRAGARGAASVAAAGSAASSEPARQTPGKGGGPARAGLVDINNASIDALMELDGINRERAKAIVKGRPYTSPGQLVTERILSVATFNKVKTRLVALKPEGS